MADWSSVFEETGEEDGDWDRNEVEVSRISVLAFFQNYNPLVAYFFTVNYVLGVGCLGIPYAFQKSGLVLASGIVIFVSLCAYVTVMFVAEVSHRGMYAKTYRTTNNPFLQSMKAPTPQRKSNVASSKSNSNKSSSSSQQNASNSNISSGMLAPTTKLLVFPQINHSSSSSSISPAVPRPQTPIDVNTHLLSTFCPQPSSQQTYNYQALSPQMQPPPSARASSNRDKKSANPLKQGRPRVESNDSIGEEAGEPKELEVTELAQEFLGDWGKVTYQLALAMLSMVGLLAYAQVFNDSFRLQVWPHCPHKTIPLIIFGSIVVPLSCIDLVEQIHVQVAMSVFRFLSLGILLFGTLLAVIYSPFQSDPADLPFPTDAPMSLSGSGHPKHHHVDDLTTPTEASLSSLVNSSVPLIEVSGFALIFTTAIFAQLFQHSVPGLIRPLKSEHKRSVGTVFALALTTTAALYIAIGCCCAFYFGDETKQSINLNFVGFMWGLDPSSSEHYVLSRLAAIGAFIVVVFPALDTLSVFPLIANTLGNNFYAAVPKTKKYLKRHLKFIFHDDKAQIQLAAKIMWRLVASIPPILGAGFITELSFSLQLAGVCGIFVALVTPVLLHKSMMGTDLTSLKEIFSFEIIDDSDKNQNQRALLLRTPYSTVFSHQPLYSTVVLLVAIVALVVCIWQMLSGS